MNKVSNVRATGFFLLSFIALFVVWGLGNAYPY
jgi:uncharacterized membrane protein